MCFLIVAAIELVDVVEEGGLPAQHVVEEPESVEKLEVIAGHHVARGKMLGVARGGRDT